MVKNTMQKNIKKNIFNFTIIYGSTRKNREGIRFVYYLANQIKLKGHKAIIVDPLIAKLPMLNQRFVEYKKSKVPENIKKTRLSELQELLSSQQRQFNSQFLDKEIEVLIEKYGERKNQVMGRSEHMQSVYMDQSLGNIGDIRKVKISYVGQNSLKV